MSWQRNLVITLVRHYGSEKTVGKGYRPATLIQATLEHVASPDTFITFLLSYIYKDMRSDEGHADDSDITHALVFFEGFSSWEPEQISKLHGGLEKFAEYIVENFFLPRSSIPYMYISLISSECMLIRFQLEHHQSRHHNQRPRLYLRSRAQQRPERGSMYLFYDRNVLCATATAV